MYGHSLEFDVNERILSREQLHAYFIFIFSVGSTRSLFSLAVEEVLFTSTIDNVVQKIETLDEIAQG